MITTTEVFTFNTAADRQAFLDAMIRDFGFTPTYTTTTESGDDPAHEKPYRVAVRLPHFMFGLMRSRG